MSGSRQVRRSRRGPAAAIAAVSSSVVALAVFTVALASAAAAQTSTTVTGVAPAGREPDPLNAGGVVFLFVAAVLFGGALLLYLRHRPRVRS